MKILKLSLFVTGNTVPSQRAADNLRSICQRLIRSAYELEVIDVLEHPARAETERVLATPTLVRQHPLPVRKIIGDLSDHDHVLRVLDLPTA